MNDIYDIIIAGGGPAGLSAGIYGGRANYNTMLFEETGTGGQMLLTDIIDNYPGFPDGISGYELQERMLAQANKFGVKIEFKKIVNIKKENDIFLLKTDDNTVFKSYSVILSTGAKHRLLGVKGEKEFSSRGVSYCGTCDGPFFKKKDVIVVGGGDTALTEGLFISKFAESVTIIHRKDRFRAVKDLVNKAESTPNIKFLFNTTLEEIKGDKFVTEVVLKNVLSNEISDMKISGVFIFVGLDPNTDFLDNSLLDDAKYVVTNGRMETNIKGIFACGDVKSGAFRQVICAASDGAFASEEAGKYVDKIKGNEYK